MVGISYIYDIISDDNVEVHKISPWMILRNEKDFRDLIEDKNKWNDIFLGKKEPPIGHVKEKYGPDLVTTKEEAFKGIAANDIKTHPLCADSHIVIESGKLTEWVRGKKYFEFII